MSSVPQHIDRLEPVFDGEPPADAGLLPAGTLADRLGLEGLVDQTLRMSRRPGGARPGRKILALVMSMLAGGSYIGHPGPAAGGAGQAGAGVSGDGPVYVGEGFCVR